MNGEYQIKKAYESILKHDFEQAIVWFEQAIAVDPNNASYHYKLSITFARSNKLIKAIEHAELAAALAESQEVYQFHVQYLHAKELIQQAEKYFHQSTDQLYIAIGLLKQAISMDPLSVEAFLLIGLAWAGLKEYNQAIQAIKDVLKLDPNHEIANNLLREYKLQLKLYLKGKGD